MTRTVPILLLLALGCGPASTISTTNPSSDSDNSADPPQDPPEPLAAGVSYLVDAQSTDGRWKSDVYATFRDGTALTPLAVVALQAADAAPDSRRRGAAVLAHMVMPDGTIDAGPDGLPYPVYTAALAVMALSHPENAQFLEARDAWADFLLARQLTEKNGWKPTDDHFGGWGYYPGRPRKPDDGEIIPAQQLLESNLSATAFAIDALDAAELLDRTTAKSALIFVNRCRNADGGFHFVARDPVRNKAGLADPGPTGEPRYRSYGSASADGARSELLLRGRLSDGEPQKPGEIGAWLLTHFSADRHPGDYLPAHETHRDAVYYYYAASAARTFRKLQVLSPETIDSIDLEQLAAAVAERQATNGSWQNSKTLVREDDPIIATAYAVWTLAQCRND